MTVDQIILVCLLGGAIVLFISGKLPPDLVAMLTLMTGVVLSIIAPEDAFLGFANPAVITVAAILIITKALQDASVLDWIALYLLKHKFSPTAQLFILTSFAAMLSGFMNNVGALALIMPIAIQTARKNKIPPSKMLMPISFASILGGLMTLIGTPPNILIANYRLSTLGESFALFDFLPIGILLIIAGIAFILLFGDKLIPKRQTSHSSDEVFEINDYIVEVKIEDESTCNGYSIEQFEKELDNELEVIGFIRGSKKLTGRLQIKKKNIFAKDILILRVETNALSNALEKYNISLVGDVRLRDSDLKSENITIVEAVVTPNSRLVRRSFQGLRLRSRYGLALLGIARQGKAFKNRINHVVVKPGDIMLFQGEHQTINDIVARLGCLPLANRRVQLTMGNTTGKILFAFIAAIVAAISGVIPIYISFTMALLFLVFTKVINMREIYSNIDWSIIVLLGALIPVGNAVATTGMADLLANQLNSLAGSIGPLGILALLMILTMTLSDILNNAATTVIIAPIALTLANAMQVNPDAFLMAVAIGASCAFLTPIGHQNNILVMGPGGYRFGDYWRLGLPLEILIVAISVPAIYFIWGF